ncbi:hypothetical protein CS063_03810 [Sporanaerobium hydrogeniformans]|uniref:Uncharacterized protein n=1 Tax=Sporanaerobium hydrogeniformans TaxID=3072179 RepID=A0AC61DFI7_9FIRM|nr:AraC family transcriptional regulator [Sporanaerobium hydrogeniformans]PHV71697.1 hypothetical protein CS063_03810 [Sporanaerobium hydrogeniformans]
MKKYSDCSQPFNYRSEAVYMPETYLYLVNRAGHGRVNKGFQIIRDSSYDYSLFHYVYQGSGLLIVGKKEYKLSKGDLFILGTREPHIYRSNDTDRLELLWIEFYGSNSTQLVNIILNKGRHVLHAPETDSLREQLITLLEVLKESPPINVFEISILLYTLMCTTIKIYKKYPQHQIVYPAHIDRGLKYIKEHLHTTINITDLARYVHCSLSYFTKSFSKAMGVTPTQYIMMLKVEEATRLLTIGSPTCEDLAQSLGFYDATHFIRTYKKYTGQTPKQFKVSQIKMDKKY